VIPAAQKIGKTIFQTEPHHKVTEQFRALGREFESRMALLDQQSATALAAQNLPTPDAHRMAATQEESLEGTANG
jgi:hypothetical protein